MTTEELGKKYSDNIICIYRTGSAILPFITNARDVDYLILVKDISKKPEIMQDVIKQNLMWDSLYNKRAEWHFFEVDKCPGIINGLQPWSYLFHFLTISKPIFGKSIDFSYGKNVLEHRQEYIEVLKVNRDRIQQLLKDKTIYKERVLKSYYYLFIGAYILYYNTYDLPKEVFPIINRAHDLCLTSEDMIAFENIFKEIIK